MGINVIDLDNPEFECHACGARVHNSNMSGTEYVGLLQKHRKCYKNLQINSKKKMTRGTIHCINGDNTITYTDQFNGDMYLDGHGNAIIIRLGRVDTHDDFIEEIENFNRANFKYNSFKSHNVIFKGDGIKCDTDDPISDPTFADYTYWKNLAGKNITFIDKGGKKLILEHGGIAVFNFARRYLKVYS